MYGIHGKYHSRLKSYILNRKQFVKATEKISTDIQLITCVVPKDSILGRLCLHLSSLFHKCSRSDDLSLTYQIPCKTKLRKALVIG